MKPEIRPGDWVKWVPGEIDWVDKYGQGPFLVTKISNDFITVKTKINDNIGFYRRRLMRDDFRSAIWKVRHE